MTTQPALVEVPAEPLPTLDDYLRAAHDLAALVRSTLDGRKINKGDVRKALERFEQLDYEAM